ncbi:hypothetical protein YPPY102_4453, partial [Yersinia pestis PY-102]
MAGGLSPCQSYY